MVFKVAMQVRDYECDLQGVVNNAVYQHYLEHARHLFLREQGLDFAQITAQGVHLMLTSIALQFKAPLRPHDIFEVTVQLKKKGRIQYLFEQSIYKAEGPLMLQAEAVGVAVSDATGRPMVFAPLEALANASKAEVK